MASRGVRSPLFPSFVACFSTFGFLFGLTFGGVFSISASGQEAEKKTTYSSSQKSAARPYLRDRLDWNWNQRGRRMAPGESAAGLRFRAYRQKMAMRAQRAAATPRQSLDMAPASGSTVWTALGPAPLASDAAGDPVQIYNWVSGRATSVLIDPADTTGNTVLLGGAYGGLWKSTNAGSQSSSPASVLWQPLIDDQPTLAVGAIALQPGNSNVILVGTGETNSSSDSYYGLGILRSADGGSTWPLHIQSAVTGQSFLGIGFSKIAFSTANPSLVVAATAGDNGLCLGEEAAGAGNTGPCLGPQEDGNSPARGLYYSTDSGLTWNRATLTDGAVPASATAVIYNPLQGATGTFYAFIRRHGLYSSTDGINFTPLATLPIPGLTSTNCPASSNATTCTIYRGEFAVVPGRNEMYAWVVDVQYDLSGDPTPADYGIWQSTTGGASWTQIPDNGITNCGDDAFGPNSGCGVEQGWYNLALAAIPDGGATDVYAGAVNLYKCTLEPGSTACTQTNNDWINLTHVYGCNPLAAPAHVHPDQHGIAFPTLPSGFASGLSPGYFAHDGGISRTLDGYSGLNDGSCSGTNQFDSLSQTLGSMTEFVSVSVDPADADILLGGTQGNGSPKTSTATEDSTWQNALEGDGGFTAINPENTNEWFAANPYVTILKCELGTACNDSGFSQVVGSNDLGGDQGAFNTPYILDPQNSSEMLVGTCRVWRISTSGTAPVQLSNDFDTLGTGVCTGNEINLVTALAAGGPLSANGNSETVYAVTNGYGPLSGSPGGEVWVTTDAGFTLMTNVTGNVNPNGYAISSVAMESPNPADNTAYIGIMGFSTSHVFKIAYADGSWTETDWSGTGATELPDAPVNALVVDSSIAPPFQIYAGTDVGVFVSSTSAPPSWTEVDPAPGSAASGFLPNAPVTALQILNYAGTKTLVASTYGRGIWSAALSPNFKIAVAATPNTTVVNHNVTWNGTLTAEDGYSGSVTLTCTAGHPVPCTVSPLTVTPTAGGAPFTVTLGSATPGTFTFTIQGTDGTLTHATQPETLTVTGTTPDFTWTDTGSATATVLAGQTASFTFSAAPVGTGTFSSTVTFACSELPELTTGLPGPSCVFNPPSIAAGTPGTPPVKVTLTIPTCGPNLPTLCPPGTGGDARRSAGTPSRLLLRSGPARTGNRPYALPFFTLAWVVVAGIVGIGRKRCGEPRLYVGIAVICLGLGLIAEISCGGVTGSGGGTGPAPDFAIVVTPIPNSALVNQNVTWNGTLTALNGYSGSVALTCTAGAPGTCTPSSVTPTTGGAPFAVTLGSETAGTFNFTIQGTDGKLTHATPTETLTVGTGATVQVTVLPGVPSSVFPNNAGWPLQTAQFTATVTGTSNTAVTWSVPTPNGGTIDANGLYTAPTVDPDLPASVTVTAFSQADATKSASTQETLNPATIPGTYSNIMVTATDSTAALSDPITLTVQ